MVNVDNFVFASSSRSAAVSAFNRVKSACAKLNLPTHEESVGVTNLEVIGWQLDGRRLRVSPSRRRSWKVWLALDALLCARGVTSKQLEVVVGHFTFLATVRRPALASMHAVYAYIGKEFKRPRPSGLQCAGSFSGCDR